MITTLTKWFRRQPATTLPSIPAVDNARITPDQRAQLRDWLQNPTTLMALGILESTRPSVGVAESGDAERNSQRAFQSIGRVQGWNHYRNNLLLLGHTPQEVRAITETYPDQR